MRIFFSVRVRITKIIASRLPASSCLNVSEGANSHTYYLLVQILLKKSFKRKQQVKIIKEMHSLK